MEQANMGLLHLVLLLFFLISLLETSSSSSSYDFSSLQETYEPEIVRWAGYGEERLSSVLVTGTVLCEACSTEEMTIRTHPLTGALVGVACKVQGKRHRLKRATASTDDDGEFIIDLPSSLHAIPRLEQVCLVRILRLPQKSGCRAGSARNPATIRLSSVGNGIRVYSAGSLWTKQRRGPLNACKKTEGDGQEKRTGWQNV